MIQTGARRCSASSWSGKSGAGSGSGKPAIFAVGSADERAVVLICGRLIIATRPPRGRSGAKRFPRPANALVVLSRHPRPGLFQSVGLDRNETGVLRPGSVFRRTRESL